MTAEAVGASSSMSAEDQHIAELVTAYQQGNQQVQAIPPVASVVLFTYTFCIRVFT